MDFFSEKGRQINKSKIKKERCHQCLTNGKEKEKGSKIENKDKNNLEMNIFAYKYICFTSFNMTASSHMTMYSINVQIKYNMKIYIFIALINLNICM